MPESKRDVYKKLHEDLKRRTEEGGIPWWRAQVGKNMIRILPNWVDPKKPFYKRVLVHWNVGDNERKVVCRKTLSPDENCPVCDFVAELMHSSSADDVRYGEAMDQAERFAMNMLDGQDLERGPQVFECGSGLFRDIIWMFSEGDYGDLDDYKEGRYVLVDRTGTGMRDTKYAVMPAAKTAPIDPAAVKDAMNNLDEVYAPYTTEEIVAILEGKEPEDVRREAEEQQAEELVKEEPATTGKKKPSDAGEEGKGGLTPPTADDFEAAKEPAEKSAEKGKSETKKPAFSRSEKVDERLRKLRRPSDKK